MRQLTFSFLLLLVLFVIAFTWLSFSKTKTSTPDYPISKISKAFKRTSGEFLKLQLKAFTAKVFTKQNHFDTSFCFLIDMNLPANRKRFFVYDLKRDTVLNSGLVAHGNCNQLWLEERKYGNEMGCGCTSLGKYKIGNSYYGRFGLAFKLYGLDETNSNAFKRSVVLHSHSCVPESEVVEEVCQSNGCPTPEFLKRLELMIKNAKEPVLWIFDGNIKG